MEKVELQALVEQGLSTRAIGAHYSFSQSNAKWWLQKHGLKSKHRRFSLKPHLCKRCGETDPVNFYKGRKECCRRCFVGSDGKIGKEKKLRAIAHLGGCCVRCGYNRHYGALEFHHLDRTQKDDNWASVRGWGWDRIVKELKKCILVCANCHREIHAGLEADAGVDPTS